MRIPLPKQYYQIKDIRYKGSKIRTYKFGVGSHKVFTIPGFPHSGLIFLYIFLNYDLDKIQVVTFDLPGWIGESDSIYPDGNYDEDETIRLITHICDIFDFKEFSLMGYSFGTSLAARLLALDNYKIDRVAFVSGVLKGVSINDRKVRTALWFIRKFKAYQYANKYIDLRFKTYQKELKAMGMEDYLIREYWKMIHRADGKVLYSSLNHLFNSDYTDYVKHFKNKNILVVNSLTESPYFRRQAEHLRRVLDGEKTIFLTGNHEDFALKPNKEYIKEVMDFLAT